MKPMHFLKALGRVISSVFLKLSLLVFALAFSFVAVLGAPDTLKQGLKDNNIYDQAVGLALDAAEKPGQEDADSQLGSLPLDEPEVRQAAQSAFPADTLETWGGQIIDGFYGWIEGKTEKPEFQIDMTAQKQAFAQNIADAAEQKAMSLRPCTRQEALQLARQEIDLFNLPCRPPIDLASEKQRLVSEIENNNNFFGDNVITSEDLVSDPTQQEQFKTHPLPTIFQSAKRLPVIAVVIALLSAACLLWLSDDKRRGFRKVGLVFVSSGAFLLVMTLLFGYLFNQANGPDSLSKLPGAETGGLQAPLMEVMKYLLDVFNNKVITITLIYLLIGAGLLLATRNRPVSKSLTKSP